MYGQALAYISTSATVLATVLAGGENGFNQAIELSADTLANVKFVQEKRLISKFFDEISQDTSKYVFGVSDTLQCLEMGAVDTLIVWEDLPVWRYELMNSVTGRVSRNAVTSGMLSHTASSIYNRIWRFWHVRPRWWYLYLGVGRCIALLFCGMCMLTGCKSIGACIIQITWAGCSVLIGMLLMRAGCCACWSPCLHAT